MTLVSSMRMAYISEPAGRVTDDGDIWLQQAKQFSSLVNHTIEKGHSVAALVNQQRLYSEICRLVETFLH